MAAFDDIAPLTIPATPDEAKKWGWEPHEQVILKGSIDVSDQEYVANRMGKSSANNKGIELQMGTGRYSLLDRMILSWSLTRNGQPVPVTSANIRRLPSRYSTPILDAIDAIANTMSEEEQENFLSSASEPIVDSSVSLKLVHGN